MKRFCILFLPSLIGLLWRSDPGLSILWSLAGSVFIAAIAQTRWFRECKDSFSFSDQLLRPFVMFHLSFTVAHIVGGAFYALDNAGYTFLESQVVPSQYRLAMNASAQALMLLAHASVTAGMKLRGFNYVPPKYIVTNLPPYALIILSTVCSIIGTALSSAPATYNLGGKVLSVASTAVMIELAFAVRRKYLWPTIISSVLVFINIVLQTLSGWKGLTLWSVITLGAMLYTLMPVRVVCGTIAFVLLWALVLHPFGLEFRPLSWYEGLDQSAAVEIALNRTLSMSWDERLNGVWLMMVGRANELYQFQRYLEYVPQRHPYFEFDLVRESFMGLIPRLLWTDKPDLEGIAMQRVYEAGVVSAQSSVSAKSNFYQDAYLSWGWRAIIGASILLGFVSMEISHICERYFGGYHIGTCLIYTSLFGTGLRDMPNFLFWVGTMWTSLITACGLFAIGCIAGWFVPAWLASDQESGSVGQQCVDNAERQLCGTDIKRTGSGVVRVAEKSIFKGTRSVSGAS